MALVGHGESVAWMRHVLGKENLTIDGFKPPGSGPAGRKSAGSLRTASVPVTYAGQRPSDPRQNKNGKKDHHWLVWKTTPTPQTPSTPADTVPSRAPAPVPPLTPAPPPMTPGVRPPSSRARSVASRACFTPAFTPAPLEDIRALSPEPFRVPSAQPPLETERGFTPAPPTPASAHPRLPTPTSMQVDYHDNMASPQMFPKATAVGAANGYEPRKFVPALNAWVATATDQEKDVAFNLFKALNAGMNPLKIHKVKAKAKGKPRAASASRSDPLKAPPGGPTQLYRQHPAGVLISAPDSKAYLDKNIEAQYLKLVAKSIQQAEPGSYSYSGQGNGCRPWATHQTRTIAAPDYTHENSFFQWSRPPPKRDFIIRPDWVSENIRPHTTGSYNQHSYSTPKRKNSMPQYRSHFIVHPEWISETTAGSRNLKLLMCTKGENGIRYMAQRT